MMMEQARPATDEPTDPEEAPAFLTRRRLIRWAAVVGIGIVAVLACWQDPSYAHESTGRSGSAGALLPVGGAAALVAAAVGGTVRRRGRRQAAAA
jgi:hypothetical protein